MISSPDLSHEQELWRTYKYVAGLDEAGRGALAGPVCVGAVILPDDNPLLLQTLSGVRDSKQLTPRKRRPTCAAHQRDRARLGHWLCLCR